ncbi:MULTISPECIES: alkaline phosphatase D family protein [unclassified Bradyrhizobium]|uniref:alkaline phosphatase D family protein n=1 Tax=unclassified Bradyrhizobium TaxID=2631580 RepID=UPI001FF9937A|nr:MULTISPECIES: alkaline phosphatase D family protein [unclassified Bradyrhizobium]MCK1266222.1 alkaline phosphatase D family protein [Bradyrhizobium sp. 84]MCK1374759.1 alkaline phosphatase D family protein [Bradyrhizobium sp. 49]MCK1431061.1 alkaline phosphatase D family protein [Bradyrhizobium sp. 87]
MVALRASRAWTRRQFLVRSTSSLAVAALATPHLSRAADRPQIAGGIQSGDVSDGSAVIWARADRQARMRVDYSSVESFKTVIASASGDASPDDDFTSKLLLDDLPPGQDIFYRVRFDDIATGIAGESRIGHFRTAPAAGQSISFLWSGDTAGQGWGIDTSRGGYRSYRTMLDNRPDFFIHSGDHIYADCTIPSEQKLPNGEIWRNVVTEEKSEVAYTLAQFRGNYKYNHLDEHFRAFHAEVPMFAQWDDHEVTNDWSPTGSYDAAGHEDDGTPRLVARARRAFFDFMPIRDIGARKGRVYRKIAYGPLLDVFMIDMRSYRDESWNKGDDHRGWILGAEQLAWLKREVAASRATWKVIAADLPIGLVSLDAVALGDGPPDRREHEIADLLASIKRAGIRNIVWLTADMHYTAAHYYDPNRAQFQEFEPFWEFVSGPLHAGTWGPGELDNTFGPVAMYQNGCSEAQGENLAPCFGLQFFGKVDIDGRTGVMTVTLKDVDNRDLWSVDIEPQPQTRPAVVAQHS